jgi:hypothetical protein
LIENGRSIGGIGVVGALVRMNETGKTKVICSDFCRVAVFKDLLRVRMEIGVIVSCGQQVDIITTKT